MKHVFKTGAVAIILALGTTQGRSDETNLVQILDLQLTGIGQGVAVTNGNFAMSFPALETVGTARLIAALGTATGNSFSKAAKITVTTLLPDGSPSFTVTDGTSVYDVSGFFNYQQLGDPVESWVLNLKTGKAFTTTYSVCQLTLQNDPDYPSLTLHFDIIGMAVESLSVAGTPGPFGGPGAGVGLSATVTGAGDLNGNSMLLQGTFAFHGNTLVVVPGSGSAGD